MKIVVTHHAIKRYRERMFDFRSSDDYIIRLMISAAREGTLVKYRPGGCKEVFGKGIYLVLITDRDQLFVVTCLGDIRYLKWIRREGLSKKIGQVPVY